MGRIVVGVDGSQHSLGALEWACREAELRGDSLELVSAWSLPAVSSEAASAEVVEALQGAAKEAGEAGRQLAQRVAPGVPLTVRSYRGQAARVLVERARGADLLVVGSRGMGDFKALLLGSVSQECSHHSPVPVVIVRRGDSAPATPPAAPPE